MLCILYISLSYFRESSYHQSSIFISLDICLYRFFSFHFTFSRHFISVIIFSHLVFFLFKFITTLYFQFNSNNQFYLYERKDRTRKITTTRNMNRMCTRIFELKWLLLVSVVICICVFFLLLFNLVVYLRLFI